MSDETRPLSDGGAGRSPCVFVTGGTGLIGRKVSLALRERRARVVVLTRDAAAAAQRIGPGVELVEGDPTIAGAWQEVLAQANAVVNLAGEPIFAGRWTKARKRRIRASRVQAATNVAQAAAGGTPEVLVSASAIGYYGPRGDEQLTETAAPGTGFMAELVVAWEAAAQTAGRPGGCRIVTPRIGVVLAADGGALAEMTRPFRFHVGGRVGRGTQWVSWIHIDDLVALILMAIENPDLSGPVNTTAPEPVTNADLARTLAAAIRRKSWLPVPRPVLRLVLGEVACLVTQGQRVLPAKALAAGFRFRYANVTAALRNLLDAK
jgi:uncharacterized protein (TIGR01777 family)